MREQRDLQREIDELKTSKVRSDRNFPNRRVVCTSDNGALRGHISVPARVKMMFNARWRPVDDPAFRPTENSVVPEINGKFFPKVVDAELGFERYGRQSDGCDPASERPRSGNSADQRHSTREEGDQAGNRRFWRPTRVLTTGANPVTVAVKGDHLTMKVGPQEWDLFPDSETTFFLKDVDVQLRDPKRSDGAVKGLVSHIGPQDIAATRQ